MAKKNYKVVKENKLTQVVKHEAKTKQGSVGFCETEIFKEDSALLKAIQTTITLDDIKDLNRQRITDDKNDLRHFASPEGVIAQFREGKVSLTRVIKALERLAKSGDKKAEETLAGIMSLIPTK